MTVYREHQHLRFAPAQLFRLAADVERFTEFLPWVTASRILKRSEDAILVEMTIAAGPLRRRFSSRGVLNPPHRIDITSDDPIFMKFEQHWRFDTASGGGTHVDYSVDVELRSRVLQVLLAGSFGTWASATMAGFKRQAQRLYGGAGDRLGGEDDPLRP